MLYHVKLILIILFNPTTYWEFGSKKIGWRNCVVKFSGLFPPVLTEKDDKTISLSSILGFEILSEKLLMLGSVDGSLFQEEIENSHPGIFDANVCISSKNGANDDLKFLEKFFGIGEKNGQQIHLFSFLKPVIAFSLAR